MNPGQRYGEYTIIRQIGSGNMGVVYLATRSDTGQQVALKVVPWGASATAQEHIEIEQRGAALQQQLAPQDPRVVVVNRIHFTDRDLNIEMEYVDGEDLFHWIQKGPFPPVQAASITADLCEMLCRLGGQATPVVHGDLKPRNVRLRPNGQVKVIDFGIAKQMERREGTINAYQTIRYSSPERLDTTIVSRESDLWAVAVMLYEMVTGRHPFGDSAEEMRRRILSDAGPEPLPGTVPAPLRNILMKALAHNPLLRYANPELLLQDLRRFASGLPVMAPDPDDNATVRTVPLDGTTTGPVRVPGSPGAMPKMTPVPPPRPLWRAAIGSFWGALVQPPAPKPPARFPNLRRAALTGGSVIVLIAGGLQTKAWSDAGKLKQQLDQEQIATGDAWALYQKIRREAPTAWLLPGLSDAMKHRLVQSGEAPIIDYRREVPTTYEGDWQRAAADLKRAHDLDPGDKTVLGDLRICEGHLQRIRSVSGKKRQLNQKTLNSAISTFEEAGRLMPKSPDPYLGLARIYFYYEHDPARGNQMLEEAQRRGHASGKRETVQRADGLRLLADRAEQQAQQFHDIPSQERQYLEAARDDYDQALQSYSAVSDFNPSIPNLIKDTLKKKERVEQRLTELKMVQQ